MPNGKNEILDLSYELAIEIVKFTEELESRKKYNLANQLFRSGTSIGANIRESQSVHSRKDFIAKLIIASKEANETEYWLMICRDSASYPESEELLNKVESIKKLLSKIISSTKSNM